VVPSGISSFGRRVASDMVAGTGAEQEYLWVEEAS
jgi:hypothetical protein